MATSQNNPCKEPKGFTQQVGASLQIQEIQDVYHQRHYNGQYFEVVIITDDQHTGSGKAHILYDDLGSTHRPPVEKVLISGPVSGRLGFISWDALESKPNNFYIAVEVVTGIVGTKLAKVCFYIDGKNVATFWNRDCLIEDQSGLATILSGDDFTWESRSVNLQGLNVGIVGGGIAGLYAALLLQREGHHVRIFEGTDHVGGRVHTHYFTAEEDQYYEAGAMRIPKSNFHTIVYELVDYISSEPRLPANKKVNLIEYILTCPGNDVYINGIRPGVQASSATPSSVGWEVPDEYSGKTAGELMMDAIGPLIQQLRDNFQTGFDQLVEEYDNFTFRFYCLSVMGWPDEVIDFVETVTSQTNQFTLSVPELVMQNMDFDEKEWTTIDGGMSRLPQAMAYLVGYNNITFGARVTSIEVTNNDQVRITASGYNGSVNPTFDRIILAIPPAALKMIADRPRWSVDKEVAIRSMHFEALYKMGMRFKTRFWERVTPKSSKGGQSTSDLPIRWIVFPSNGIGEDGPGVLLVYAWMTDAATWLPLTPLERRSLAIHCIATMYQNEWDGDKKIDVFDLLIETSDAVWSASTATGDAMFLPGQFRTRFDVARQPEGNVYFAGEHLSYHHTWISGAANSALAAVRGMLNNQDLPALTKSDNTSQEAATQIGISEVGIRDIASRILVSGIPEPAKVPFDFKPNNPMFLEDRWGPFQGWPPMKGVPQKPGVVVQGWVKRLIFFILQVQL